MRDSLLRLIPLVAVLASACAYPVTMRSTEGERFNGRYRFGREDTGLMQIVGPGEEVLIGRFHRVGRTTFAEGYQKTFGAGTIDLDGPDLSLQGAAIGGILGSSVFHETAYADPAAAAAGRPTKSISGPLFYWVATLQGDRRSVLGCYLIGSSYTGSGFGRCKSQTGKEYLLDF